MAFYDATTLLFLAKPVAEGTRGLLSEVDLASRAEHDCGVVGLNGWFDDLQVSRKVEPRCDRCVVVNLASLHIVGMLTGGKTEVAGLLQISVHLPGTGAG